MALFKWRKSKSPEEIKEEHRQERIKALDEKLDTEDPDQDKRLIKLGIRINPHDLKHLIESLPPRELPLDAPDGDRASLLSKARIALAKDMVLLEAEDHLKIHHGELYLASGFLTNRLEEAYAVHGLTHVTAKELAREDYTVMKDEAKRLGTSTRMIAGMSGSEKKWEKREQAETKTTKTSITTL